MFQKTKGGSTLCLWELAHGRQWVVEEILAFLGNRLRSTHCREFLFTLNVKHTELTEEDNQQIEDGGGLSEQTKEDREIVYQAFADWIQKTKEGV